MRLPAKVGGYQSTVINDLIDYVAAITPLPSSGLNYEHTPSGYFAHPVMPQYDDGITRGEILLFGDGIVRVNVMTWTRNNNHITLALDSLKDYKSFAMGSAASDIYYIYVQLDDAEAPTTLTVAVSQTNPPDDSTNLIMILGTISTDSGGNHQQPVMWRLGDHRDWYISPASVNLDELSINLNPASDIQIWNWHDSVNNQATPTDFCYFIFQEPVGMDLVLRYVTLPNLITSIGDGIDLSERTDYKHTNLDYGDWTAALGTGKSGGNTDHDDSYHHEYTTSSNIDTKSWRTTGDYWAGVLHASADGTADTLKIEPDTITALGKLDISIAASSLWTVAGLQLTPNGAVDLELGTSANRWNKVDIYATSGSRWMLDDLALLPGPSPGVFDIGSAADVWAAVNVFGAVIDIESVSTLNLTAAATLVLSMTGLDVNGESAQDTPEVSLSLTGGGTIKGKFEKGIFVET